MGSQLAVGSKFSVIIWDLKLDATDKFFEIFESLGLSLHSVDGIDAVSDMKFNNTAIFFYVVDKYNYKFENIAELKRKYWRKKFVCIDMVGFESLRRICEVSDIEYEVSIKNISDLERYVFDKTSGLLLSEANSRSAEVVDKYSISKLIFRIEETAVAIQDLRLNSTSEIVDELFSISRSLKGSSNFDEINPTKADISIKGETKNALTQVAIIYNLVENSRLAALIVSGGVTSLIGCGGWSAVACQAVCLASWHGKDTLLAAIDKLPGPKRRETRKSKTR